MRAELEALRLLRADADVHGASRVARQALAAVDFPRRRQWDPLYPVPATLTAQQREVATALANQPNIDVGDFALPGSARFRRRWLGLAPPSPLERLVDWEHEGEAVRWPLWHLWQVLQAEGEEEEVLELVVDSVDRLVVAYEVELGDMSGYLLDDPFEEGPVDHVRAAGEAAVPWAEAASAELLELFASDSPATERNHASSPSLQLRILALLPLAVAGRPIPAALLPWIPIVGHPWATPLLLEALPPDIRAEHVREQLAGEFSRLVIGIGLAVLEHLPDPGVTALVAEAMKDRGLRAMGSEWMAEQKRHLAAIAATEPEVMAAVRKTRLRLPRS